MIRGKKYRYDDEFKAKARAHQFAFRENELNDFFDEKNPQVILSPDAAKQGLIFCDIYRELIKSKVKSFKSSALFSNMLRSEHIPYNIFIPLEEEYPDKKKDCIMFENIAKLAKELGYLVIAEGVETEKQYEYLRDVGCDIIQGFYFDKPMPEEKFLEKVVIGQY